MHPRIATAATLCTLALAGCGPSTASRHEKIVRCTGFSQTLLATDSTDSTLQAAGTMIQAKYGISAADTVPMGAASTTYAAAMDPARVTTLITQGKADAADLLAKKDPQGIADYTKSCVDTFKALGSK